MTGGSGLDLRLVSPPTWGERDPAWSRVRSETIEVRGHPVAALRHFAAAGADGPPQLLVHGLGGSARNWLEVMPGLARFGEVLAVDLPGFGQTELPDRGSARVRANVGFLRALLDELGWAEAVVLGNSMGGALTTLLAASLPDRVARTVLVNPALPAPRRDMLRLSRRVVSRLLPAAVPGVGRVVIEAGYRFRTPEELVDESLEGISGDVTRIRPALREVLVENAAHAREEPWRRAALAEAANSLIGMIASANTLVRAVDAVTAPTLLLWGDADRLVSTYVVAGLSARRPDWAQHVFRSVGHAPMIEAPEEFLQIVGDWYQRPDRFSTRDAAEEPAAG